jgi:outer membrane receptor protein involved in Fe transport
VNCCNPFRFISSPCSCRACLHSGQIQQLGGGPSQFNITQGFSLVNVNQVDVGAFVGDDWRVKPNLTLSLGLRFETQTNIHDWHDWAPRVGFAWAPGQSKNNPRPKTVFRGGFGIFYDRVSEQTSRPRSATTAFCSSNT